MINNTSNNATVITPSVDPGMTAETLLNLGIIAENLTINESIGGTDRGDFYQIEISEAGTYNFTLDGLTANADIAIYDSQGQAVNHSISPADTQSESLDVPLTAGSYFVVVFSSETVATEYTLNISHPNNPVEPPASDAIAPTSDPDFTFDTAYDLGAVAGNLTVNESVGGTDAGDGYQFAISESGKYSFTLDGLSADANLYIYDSEYNVVDYSTLTGNEAERIDLDLTAGTYFAAVGSFDGQETTYNFNIASESGLDNPIIDSTIITPPSDPGYDTFDDAYDLGTVAGTIVVEENVGTDIGDLYKITVDEAGEYTFDLDGLAADANLYLFNLEDVDSEGSISPFESSTITGTESESIAVELDAGEYYVDIASVDGEDTNYSLTISDGEIPTDPVDTGVIAPPQDPGASLGEAFDLGAIDTTKIVAESVGQVGTAVDTMDLYKFTAGAAGEYTFNLDGLAANADLVLLDPDNVDADGALIALETSQETGTASEVISTELDAGEYYAAVISRDEVYTDYTLSFTGHGVVDRPPVDDGGIIDDGDLENGGDAGGTFDTSLDLGAFASGDTLQYSESIGGGDDIDAFGFSLAESAQFQATLDGLSADVDLYLFDETREQIGFSGNTETAAEGLGGVLDAGTYYLGVISYDGMETGYDLSFAIDGSTSTPPISLDADVLETFTESFL